MGSKKLGVVEHAMEAQARIRRLRKDVAPMFEAALGTGDWNVVAETKALAETLRIGQLQAKRLAGMADRIPCVDGILAPGHGRAA